MAYGKPGYVASDVVRAKINVGAGCDIITGEWETGQYGESILNGGQSTITGYVGQGNQFKSTIEEYHNTTAQIRMLSLPDTPVYYGIYDTEANKGRARVGYVVTYIQRLHDFPEFDFSDAALESTNPEKLMLEITDSSKHLADEWWEIKRAWLLEKRKNKSILYATPFIDKDGKSLYKIPVPSFDAVDSASEFITSNVVEKQNKAALGHKDGNMIYANTGLAKKRFIGECPSLCLGAMHYMSLVAHFAEKKNYGDDTPKPRLLQWMPEGMTIKGVPDNFTFLTHNCWYAHGTKLCINETTKSPEYPRTPEENIGRSRDLVEVKMQNWRGKSGQAGIVHTVVASQTEGILPSLTELHFLRNTREDPKLGPASKMYGLTGPNISKFTVDLYPGKSYTRTTIRNEIDSDFKLRRALNISMELCQMFVYWQGMDDILVKPSVLYEGLVKLGYDWNILLNTRGWWALENDSPKHKHVFLSSMDLLKMLKGEYFPYWLEDDKRTLKKPYRKKEQ